MYRKIHLRKKFKIKFKGIQHKFILIVILFILAIFLSFKYINTKVSPLVADYANVEAKNISTYILNKAISMNISDIINTDELFIVSKNSNNEINTIDFNPVIVNKALTEITQVIHIKLHALEEGNIEALDLPESSYYSDLKMQKKGVLFEIPSGVVFQNALLSNLGPKIPVKLSFVGDIISNINTKVTNYGINNALIEINLNIKVTEKVILPISINEVEIELSVPVALKLIQGNIPNYYLNGLTGNSSILTVPVE